MEQWFDLHLYFAKWGSRRLILRFPLRLLDRPKLQPFLRKIDWVEVRTSVPNLIVDVFPERQAEQRRQAEEAEEARRARLIALRRRGEAVWRDVEDEIERRNGPGYDRATGLLIDLQALAAEEGTQGDFDRRFAAIRTRHENKAKLIERLARIPRNSADNGP